MSYCVHVHRTVSNVAISTHHAETATFDGTDLLLGTRLDGSRYWRAWAPYPLRLLKAHETRTRCDFGDGCLCCQGDGYKAS